MELEAECCWSIQWEVRTGLMDLDLLLLCNLNRNCAYHACIHELEFM